MNFTTPQYCRNGHA